MKKKVIQDRKNNMNKGKKKKIEKFGNREGNYKWFGFPGVWEAEK